MMSKAILRKTVLQRRAAMSDEEVRAKSAIITERLRFYQNGCTALYRSYGKEVCVDAAIRFQDGLPKVLDEETMAFYEVDAQTCFETGAYGIQEPLNGRLLSPNELQVIVVPVVAFDASLHRMGHGKGYYDRYLAHCDALKIGVAFACQQVEEVIVEPHDVALDIIITEEKIWKARTR